MSSQNPCQCADARIAIFPVSYRSAFSGCLTADVLPRPTTRGQNRKFNRRSGLCQPECFCSAVQKREAEASRHMFIHSFHSSLPLLNPPPNSSPTIRIGIHRWLNHPNSTAITNSRGQNQSRPSPNTNFAALHASFNPIHRTPKNSISIISITNITLTSHMF